MDESYIDLESNTLVIFGATVPLDGVADADDLARSIATALGGHAVGGLVTWGERTLRVSGPPWKVEALS